MKPWAPWKLVDTKDRIILPTSPWTLMVSNQTTKAILMAMGKIK